MSVSPRLLQLDFHPLYTYSPWKESEVMSMDERDENPIEYRAGKMKDRRSKRKALRLNELKNKLMRRAESSEVGFRIHATVFFAVNAFLFLINMITSRGFPWFYFPFAGWGIGLVSHFQAMRNVKRHRAQIESLADATPDQLRVLTRIQSAESNFRAHMAAFLSVSTFLIGTNLITSHGFPLFPWFLFPASGWGPEILPVVTW